MLVSVGLALRLRRRHVRRLRLSTPQNVMNVIVCTRRAQPAALDVEVVERKGIGHPDTVADTIAEAVSILKSIL